MIKFLFPKLEGPGGRHRLLLIIKKPRPTTAATMTISTIRIHNRGPGKWLTGLRLFCLSGLVKRRIFVV
jgi:hypothetical protein